MLEPILYFFWRMYLHMNNRLFSRNDLVRLIIPLIVDQFLQVAVGLSDSIMVALHGSRHRRCGDCRTVSWKKRSENRLRSDRPAF